MVDFNTVFGSSVTEAVNSSVSANKPLIVYITEESEAQDVWINGLMTQDLLDLIAERAICLKLIKNSSECQMFEQIFPNVIVPSIFCIKVAAVLDVIHGDIEKDAFAERINKVLESPSSTSVPQQQQVDVPQSQPIVPPPVQTPVQSAPVQPVQHFQPASTPIPTNTSNLSNSNINSTTSSVQPPASIIKKNPVQKKEKSLKEQIAEMNIKKYKEEQLRKKEIEKKEMERVKRLLKSDQEERKLKAKRKTEERERQRRLSNDEEIDDISKIDEIIHEQQTLKDNIRTRNPSHSGDICLLSIKLLDGSSLRHSFDVNKTLNDVREWVDENRTDGNDPYCFHRTIPRITFDIIDEEKTLETLELIPRSALILKPYNNFSNSYANTQNSNRGVFSRILTGLGSFWGGGNQQPIALHGEEGPISAIPERDIDIEVIQSANSSQYASPAHSPTTGGNALDLSHPSALSLNLNLQDQPDLAPQRPLTPQGSNGSGINESPMQNLSRTSSSQVTQRIRTLNRNDDRTTYNGNHTNLEDDK